MHVSVCVCMYVSQCVSICDNKKRHFLIEFRVGKGGGGGSVHIHNNDGMMTQISLSAGSGVCGLKFQGKICSADQNCGQTFCLVCKA